MAEEMGSDLVKDFDVRGSMIVPHAVMRNLSGRTTVFDGAVSC